MRETPIRSVRTPLPELFEADMKRIKEEREKLIQEISDRCMTASDFKRIYQGTTINTEKKEDYKQ